MRSIAVVVLLAVLLLPRGQVAQGQNVGPKGFRCACTVNCSEDDKQICRTEHHCFTQFINITNKRTPIAWGCIAGNTLLCERWMNRATLTSAYVVCCQDDLCNSVDGTPRATKLPKGSHEVTQLLTPFLAAQDTTRGTSYFVGGFHTLDKHVVFSTLVVGLFALICVLSFGFYLLYKQRLALLFHTSLTRLWILKFLFSQTMKQFWKAYNRGGSEMIMADPNGTAAC